MRTLYWLSGTLLFGLACSSGESTGTGEAPPPSDEPVRDVRDRPPADDFGVRFGGGETADFGNGSDTPCGTRTVDTVISQEQAEQEGLDVDGDRTWLGAAHDAALLYNPSECDSAPEVCNDTRVELSAQVVDVIRVQGRNTRPSEFCPEQFQRFAYRVAVNIRSDDENVSGAFYARVDRSESDAGVITVRGQALPDLRNFEGQLPLKLEPARAHYAFMGVRFALVNDGSASGDLQPSISYYDDLAERIGVAGPIGPEVRFGPDVDPLEFGIAPARAGMASTLTTYPGSSSAPLVDLRVRAEAVEPVADVGLTVRIDGEEVHSGSVAAGQYVELGRHPFGTVVSVDVHNSNGAGTVRANVRQDGCGGASSMCSGQNCAAHVEYTAAHTLCYAY